MLHNNLGGKGPWLGRIGGRGFGFLVSGLRRDGAWEDSGSKIFLIKGWEVLKVLRPSMHR